MKITAIRPYSGPSNSDGTVDVYDITVDYTNRYTVCGVVVSNSKRISLLDTNALLSHGATETLNDAGSVRGQENTQWWLQTMNGLTPTEPRVPHTYLKFVDSLKASGINVVPKGGQLQVMALTDKDLDRMAGDRRIVSGDTVRFDKGLKPVTGGLFDPKLTGGHGGKRWSAIDLHEPLPNPVMEEPIRRLLGLTQKKFEAVISGEEKLAEYGSGSSAIKKALEDINVERDIILTRAKVGASRGQKRDDANRRLDYLKSLQRTGLQPADWIMSKAPVLPPAFRPVSVMGSSGTPLVSDSNYLYKELLEANDILKEMKGHVGEDGVGNERLAVYNAFKAVTGLGEPITPKSKEKKLKGILAGVFGSSPKYGMVQRKLISSTVDNVGRAVISPNPEYDMDTVGLPEDKAFDVYEKFVVRRLRRAGMPITRALQEVKDRSKIARNMLVEEMDKRPVFINRAPVLHRFGIMAFRPQLVKSDTMQISPLVTKGFGADFDGDAMQFHVPSTDEAVKEAYERMMPSKNLISPADFKSPVHSLSQEYLGGLYRLSKPRESKRKRTFRSVKDAVAAHARGEIGYDDKVHVLQDR